MTAPFLSGDYWNALWRANPLSAGIPEEVYFPGDGAQKLPQSVLLHLTEAKPFREFAHKHIFRCFWLERWNGFGWMMHNHILSESRLLNENA
ncbi:hypothetical protein [Agrobacterium pusense]|uniref:hypothetical protein n=1 Tax=Agrobacterium pusense TaxID=648995 RepID=UPI00156AC685|nr:hypothetical protein [Agrobacterium pusense]QKJ94534.1 hypothetical protein HQN82_24340 [Agrobacterium pusense]